MADPSERARCQDLTIHLDPVAVLRARFQSRQPEMVQSHLDDRLLFFGGEVIVIGIVESETRAVVSPAKAESTSLHCRQGNPCRACGGGRAGAIVTASSVTC